MIEIIKWPKQEIRKYTFLCKYCKAQWMCDIGDAHWDNSYCSFDCPICGRRNSYYSYQQGTTWTEFRRGIFSGTYEIPLLDIEKGTDLNDYC